MNEAADSRKRPRSAQESVAMQLRAAPLNGLKPRHAPCFDAEEEADSVSPVAAAEGKTFVVSGAMGMNHKLLRQLLASKGWREVPIGMATTETVDFVWVEMFASRFDPRSYKVKCTLKNLLVDEEKRAITDKGRLHAAIQQQFPENAAVHLAPTRLLRDVRSLIPGQVLILRPVGQWARAGNGIVRITSNAELDEARRAMLSKLPDAIASEYITEHLLWNGLKFHCRMYFLACGRVGNKRPFTTELWHRGKILTAAKPFVAADFWDRDIHDSHVGTTKRNLFFPEDLVGVDAASVERIFTSMKDALVPVAKLLEPHAKSYSESRFAYEVFGCDFLITRDLRAVLLEVNERIGFLAIPTDPDPTRYEQFSREYYSWVWETAIAPMFAAIEKLDSQTDAVI